jgi:hypothetical protein
LLQSNDPGGTAVFGSIADLCAGGCRGTGASGCGEAAAGGDRPEVTVQVSRRDCRRMVHAVMRDDVRFKSGVDVRGKPVAPADLQPRAAIQVPDTIVIPITVDLCQRVDLTTGRHLCRNLVPTPFTPVQPKRYEAEAQVGTVVARRGGREIYFNGQPLHDQEAVLIREACEHFLKGER